MEYCYKCGNKLTIKYLKNEGDIPFCEKCNEFIFPIFNSAVSMIIINKNHDKTLFIQQYKRQANILVAGYVNKFESLEEALKRELMEEVGLNISNYYFNKSEYFAKSNTLISNFIVEVESEEFIRNEEEVDLVTWFNITESKEVILQNSLASKFLDSALEKIEKEEIIFKEFSYV